MASPQSVKSVEETWPIIQDVVDNIIDMADGTIEKQRTKITSEVYMNIYTIVYNICEFDHNRGPECQKLYDRYNKVFEDYISSIVLPCLAGKEDENLLQEVVTRWDNHKLMTRWMSRLFMYLNRYFVRRKMLPNLQESSYSIFHKLVLVGDVQESLMRMIERVRWREEINQSLLKTAINMYLEIGKDYYEKDFEENILKQTHKLYSLKALKWINSMDYGDYMTKVTGCVGREKDWVALYLEEDTGEKLLKAVNYELLEVHENKLEEQKIIHLEAVYMQFLYMKLQEQYSN